MYTDLKDQLTAELDAIEQAGTTKRERVITTPQGSHVTAGPVGAAGGEVLNFCANNYLGLADHPEIVAAAHRALDDRGFGMASVRFICGTQDLHLELEAELSRFLGTEDTILFSSCFDANGAVFEPLFGQEDAIISACSPVDARFTSYWFARKTVVMKLAMLLSSSTSRIKYLFAISIPPLAEAKT